MKDVNIKEDAKATTGFVKNLMKDPIEEVKTIANDSENKNFKIAILLVIVWAIANLVPSLKYFKFSKFFDGLLDSVKLLAAPILAVVVMALVLYFMTKKSENKKSLITLLTTVTTVKLPIIVAEVLSILTLVSSKISTITNRIGYIAEALSIVMMYFAVKEIFGKKDEKSTFKTFAIVQIIYFAVSLVLTFLEIYIY